MKLKNVAALVLSAAFALATLTACGGSEPAEAVSSEAASEPAVASEAASEASEVATEEESGSAVVTLDYDTIASWVAGGYIGVSDAGEGVLFAFSEDGTYCGLFFADPNSGNAVSFIGDFTVNDDGTATISDEVNGMSMTFGAEQTSDTVWDIDMGDELGTAHVEQATQEEVLSTLQDDINNYTQIG